MVSCTGCDYTCLEPFQSHRVVYRSDAGDEVKGRSAAGWCYECDGYRDIEWMNLKDLAVELAETRDCSAKHRAERDNLSKRYFYSFARRSAVYRVAEDEARHAADLQDLIGIALRRSSKPRCLVCGRSNTANLEFQNGIAQNFRHECGGWLNTGPDVLGTRVNFGPYVRCHVLDEEGNRLGIRVEQRLPSPFVKNLMAGRAFRLESFFKKTNGLQLYGGGSRSTASYL